MRHADSTRKPTRPERRHWTARGRSLLRFVLALVVVAASGTTPALAVVPSALDAPTSAAGAPTSAVTAPTSAVTASARAKPPSLFAPSISAGEDVEIATTFALTPARPGSIDVALDLTIPDRVAELTLSVPPNATVTDASGFRETADGYGWTGERTPRLSYRFAANRTQRRTGPEAADGQFLLADAGPWALIAKPGIGVRYRYAGRDVGVVRSWTTDGPGVVGESLVFLGPHERFRASANGQRFSLVVPEAATATETPPALLGALRNASALSVGVRDDDVLVVAAPSGVPWGVRGLQVGDADFWVRADASLDGGDNVWFHEYVHARQAFEPTADAAWLVEGTATYYAALLSLEHGRAPFEEFRATLAEGSRAPQSEAVLAEPSTWENHAEYRKGALVAGALDYRIRESSDATLADVIRRLNDADGAVSNDQFVRAVEAVAGPAAAAAARRMTTTRETPELWNRSAHVAAFGPTPPIIRYGVAGVDRTGALRVEGPYRDETMIGPRVTLVPGETLVLDATVENRGGSAGRYRASVRVDDEPVASVDGTLAPNESHTSTVAHTFETLGNKTVTFRGTTLTVEVREPAAARVTAVDVTDDPVAGRPVGVAVTVTNDAEFPGETAVELVVDGATVDRRTVRLAPGETTTVRFERTFAAGTHTVGVADGPTATVAVGSATGSDDGGATAPSTADPSPAAGSSDRPEATTETTAPGFGVGSALASTLSALVVLLFAAARRRRR